MMGQADYADKIRLKVELAVRSELPLIVVAPEDLYRLDAVLGALLTAPSGHKATSVPDA